MSAPQARISAVFCRADRLLQFQYVILRHVFAILSDFSGRLFPSLLLFLPLLLPLLLLPLLLRLTSPDNELKLVVQSLALPRERRWFGSLLEFDESIVGLQSL